MKNYRFEGVVTALSSISHNGGESLGIESKLRREKYVQPDGSVEEIPVISGNGMRGLLRDVGMLHMVRRLGYGDNGSGLPLAAFHFLFSGGSLSAAGGKTLNLERARSLRELIPLVGLFGGGIGNSMLPGKLVIGKLIPICRQSAHLLPERLRPSAQASCWDLCQQEMFTRKDDAKSERFKPLIESRDRLALEGETEQRRLDAEAGVDKALEPGAAQQMMYYVETLAAGTRFYWRIEIHDPTPIEFESFAATLVEFSRRPYIGGKSGTGHGEVAVDFDSWQQIDSRVQPAGEAVGLPLGEAYIRHLDGRRDDIRRTLEAMA